MAFCLLRSSRRDSEVPWNSPSDLRDEPAMKLITQFTSAILLVGMLAACVPYTHTRVLEAEERAIFFTERPASSDANARKIQVLCPEPSPDALKTLAASMNVEKQEVAAIAAAYSEAGANIGLRTHSIQLLRDQLFAICQAYANEGITAPTYQMLLTRNQRNTVALMAIEQLTGVLRTPAVTLSGASSIGPNKALITALEQLKAGSEKEYNALSAADKDKEGGKALKAKIDAYDADIKKAKDEVVAAAATAESKPGSGGGVDPASVDKVTEAVKHITDQVNGVTDLFYVCLDVVQTFPKNSIPIPSGLLARCNDAFVNTPDRDVKGNDGGPVVMGGAGKTGPKPLPPPPGTVKVE